MDESISIRALLFRSTLKEVGVLDWQHQRLSDYALGFTHT